jgi:hypothetical protein
MDDWTKVRLAELEADVKARRAPKAKTKSDRFAIVNLKEMAAACAATNTHKAFVLVWLRHRARLTNKPSVAVTNTAMAEYGIHRHVKTRALRQYEAAGLIAVKRKGSGKTPVVTLLRKV